MLIYCDKKINVMKNYNPVERKLLCSSCLSTALSHHLKVSTKVSRNQQNDILVPLLILMLYRYTTDKTSKN